LLLDDRPAEDKIIADGYGVVRFDAMYDDFVIVGPIFDPAGTRGLDDTSKAFAQIAATGALSAIRGDDSSTDRLSFGFGDPLEPNLISRLRGTATWRKAWRKS
jgi:tungstate transport system substrate-binding protein